MPGPSKILLGLRLRSVASGEACDYLAACKTLALLLANLFCVLTAVLEARFTPEVIDATQHDDVQPQSRFNLTSIALDLRAAADEFDGCLG